MTNLIIFAAVMTGTALGVFASYMLYLALKHYRILEVIHETRRWADENKSNQNRQ